MAAIYYTTVSSDLIGESDIGILHSDSLFFSWNYCHSFIEGRCYQVSDTRLFFLKNRAEYNGVIWATGLDVFQMTPDLSALASVLIASERSYTYFVFHTGLWTPFPPYHQLAIEWQELTMYVWNLSLNHTGNYQNQSLLHLNQNSVSLTNIMVVHIMNNTIVCFNQFLVRMYFEVYRDCLSRKQILLFNRSCHH